MLAKLAMRSWPTIRDLPNCLANLSKKKTNGNVGPPAKFLDICGHIWQAGLGLEVPLLGSFHGFGQIKALGEQGGQSGSKLQFCLWLSNGIGAVHTQLEPSSQFWDCIFPQHWRWCSTANLGQCIASWHLF